MGIADDEVAHRERRLLVLIGAVVASAVLAMTLALRLAPAPSLGSLAMVGLLTCALVWSQLSPTFVAWGSEGDDVSLDEAVLIVGFVLVPTTGVILASAVAALVAQLVQRQALRKLVFNVGTHVAGSALAALVIHAMVGSVTGPLTSDQVLAVAAGAAAFCTVQALLVWLVISCATGTSFASLVKAAVGPAALSFAITASWGLLMAIAVRQLGWTIVLGVAPFVLLRALHRAERERGRLHVLLHTATATATATSRSAESVRAAVEDAARSLLGAGRAAVRATPPAPGELGVALSAGSSAGWLVVSERADAHPFDVEDHELLEGIAAVASIGLGNAEMLDRLGHAALHDPLTALPNRLLFTNRIAAAIERCTAEGTRFGLLSLDLDRFKRINDNLGHLAGDELLRQVAGRLDMAARPEDTVCRMGGDELAVIVSAQGSPEGLAAAAQRMLDSLAAPFELNGSQVFVTASVGISRFPVDGDTGELLLQAADRALSAAKAAGRNGFMIHEHDEDGAGDLALEHDLHVAIERGQLWVAYQPVVCSDGAARAVEALVRWTTPASASSPRTASSGSPRRSASSGRSTGGCSTRRSASSHAGAGPASATCGSPCTSPPGRCRRLASRTTSPRSSPATPSPRTTSSWR